MDDTSVLLLQSFSYGQVALKIFLAALLGGAIGLERERAFHPAGLRTNLVIAVASCVFTILSIEGFPLRGCRASHMRVTKLLANRTTWKGRPQRVTVPYVKVGNLSRGS